MMGEGVDGLRRGCAPPPAPPSPVQVRTRRGVCAGHPSLLHSTGSPADTPAAPQQKTITPVGRWSSRCHPLFPARQGATGLFQARPHVRRHMANHAGEAMPRAWITAPIPPAPTSSRCIREAWGRDSRVHSTAACQTPDSHHGAPDRNTRPGSLGPATRPTTPVRRHICTPRLEDYATAEGIDVSICTSTAGLLPLRRCRRLPAPGSSPHSHPPR